jgi:hypothetical protein
VHTKRDRLLDRDIGKVNVTTQSFRALPHKVPVDKKSENERLPIDLYRILLSATLVSSDEQ